MPYCCIVASELRLLTGIWSSLCIGLRIKTCLLSPSLKITVLIRNSSLWIAIQSRSLRGNCLPGSKALGGKFSWGSQRVPRLAPAAQQFATTTLSTGGGNILKALFTVLAKHCATNYRAGRTPIRGPARVVLLPAKDCSSVDGYFRDEISMATHAGAACDASLHVR